MAKIINLNRAFVFSFIVLLGTQIACKEQTPTDLTGEAIIPSPVSITSSGESFSLKKNTDIYVQSGSPDMILAGQYLAGSLRPATGFDIEVKQTNKTPRSGFYLKLEEANSKLGDEGYELTVAKRLVTLSANTPAGLMRGIQTIRQILPAEIELKTVQERVWEISTGSITDYPDYSYRGAMLDVARHFFGVEDVKRLIDFLAYYKMNVLHMHLADDQGWRIEIKSWPNLAIHGGSTQVGGEAGGYYTQEQYSDIVKYAAERYITIIPEIDMPGHTNAALSSYAELNCDGKATELYTGTRVGFSTLCTDKEITYKFIDDVIRELSALTPGKYIHIGGDESHVTKVEDYIPFINRVQEIVSSHGKLVIGWDDISIASMKSSSVAQHWSNVKNANAAVSQGAKIVMSPAKKAYMDMKYDRTTKLGLTWAGLIEVDTAYIWDPATYVSGIGKENILGVEAPLWTETITNINEIEFMIFPRLPGYAEIGWTRAAQRDWEEYKVRLGIHADRFKAMDINFYQSPLVPWKESVPQTEN